MTSASLEKTYATQFFTTLWSTVLIRGIVSILFGAIIFLYPGVTLNLLVTLFGLYVIVDGAMSLWSVYRRGEAVRNRLATALQGLAGIIAGLFCLVMPAVAALYLVILVGVWNMAVGLLQILAAIALRRQIEGEVWLIVGGLISIAFGLVIALYPASGALSIIWLLASAALVVGLILVVFALKLRALGRRLVDD